MICLRSLGSYILLMMFTHQKSVLLYCKFLVYFKSSLLYVHKSVIRACFQCVHKSVIGRCF